MAVRASAMGAGAARRAAVVVAGARVVVRSALGAGAARRVAVVVAGVRAVVRSAAGAARRVVVVVAAACGGAGRRGRQAVGRRVHAAVMKAAGCSAGQKTEQHLAGRGSSASLGQGWDGGPRRWALAPCGEAQQQSAGCTQGSKWGHRDGWCVCFGHAGQGRRAGQGRAAEGGQVGRG